MSAEGRTSGVVLRAFGDRAQVQSPWGVGTYRPKGSLRREGILAGDRVTLEGEHIVALEPRRNRLGRPPVANVDILLAVVALHQPQVSPQDLDRLLLQAEAMQLRSLVVLNKADLCLGSEAEEFLGAYREAGYDAVQTVGRSAASAAELRAALPAGLAVLAGPSGAGKSSLLKQLTGVDVEVGDVSERLGRGRHTTRAATLHRLGEGRWIADTPGFSALDLPLVEARDLSRLYPEFGFAQCRFSDCVHRAEPDCAVRAALAQGRVDPGRYARYLGFLEEIEGRPRRWH